MPPSRTDVVVVGGGPAGSAAAITLARAGLDVTVVDKAAFPRDKCCGDGLTASALRLACDLGVDPATLPSWQRVDDVVLHGPSGRTVALPLPGRGSYSVVVRRSELDAALLSLAGQAGATVMEAHAVVGTSLGPERVTTTLAGGERLQSRYVVAADGMWSPVRKQLGLTHPVGYRGEWHAFRQYLQPSRRVASATQHVWFEADLLPGYAWSFPLADGTYNVGFGVTRGHGPAVGDMAPLWANLLRRPALAAVVGDPPSPAGPLRAWPIPARVHLATLACREGRVLFAGDAAAATDPLTGEGIGQALLTGGLAAEAIVAAGPDGATRAGSGYAQAATTALAADHRLARGLSRVLAHRRGTEASLAAIDSSRWARAQFARWMFEDYPRALLFTPRRWARSALHPPPAFG